MRPAPSSSRKISVRKHDAAGIALIELIIFTALVMIVMVAALTSLESVTNAQAFQVDRSESLTSMRLALNRMTKELRQATAINVSASDAGVMSFTTYIGGVQRSVVYRASGTTLTRSLDGGTALPLVTHLASTTLFSTVAGANASDVQWVAITLRVTASKGVDTVLVLESEVNLRNRTAALGAGA